MSGLTEQEILSKHTQSLKEAKDSCHWLARNADPEQVAPRARHYGNLERSLKALEGSCRQMSMMRSDARWTRLGFVYARAMRFAKAKYVGQNWLGFRDLTQLFDLGIRRMDELATAKTGTLGPILPKNTSFLILPDEKPHQSLWTPQGRMMN